MSWLPWTCGAMAAATRPRQATEHACKRIMYLPTPLPTCPPACCPSCRVRQPTAGTAPLFVCCCHVLPQGVKHYTIDKLCSDVAAVVAAVGHTKCTLASACCPSRASASFEPLLPLEGWCAAARFLLLTAFCRPAWLPACLAEQEVGEGPRGRPETNNDGARRQAAGALTQHVEKVFLARQAR